MKDEMIEDEIMYEIEWFNKINNVWDYIARCHSEKEAENIIENNKRADDFNGAVYEYRIVKLTIKREVVK